MATTPADVVAETQDGWGIVAPSAAEDVDMQDAAAPTTSAAAAAGHHAGSNDISEGWATVDAATLTAQDAATTCSGAGVQLKGGCCVSAFCVQRVVCIEWVEHALAACCLPPARPHVPRSGRFLTPYASFELRDYRRPY